MNQGLDVIQFYYLFYFKLFGKFLIDADTVDNMSLNAIFFMEQFYAKF